MAKLDRIKIKGFKSIKEAEIPLTNLNVLIGANGAGKSNFISFFKLLNALKNNNLNGYVSLEGGADCFLYFGSKITEKIELELNFNNVIFNSCLTSNKKNQLLINCEKLFDKKNEDNVQIVQSPNGTFSSFISQYSFKSFSAYHFNDTSFQSRIKTTPRINDNEYLKPDGANLSAYLYLIKEKYPENYKHIVKTIQLVAPFFEDFKLRPNPLNPDIIRLEWTHKGKEEDYFDISDLSDGTLRFICLATLLLQPNPPETIIIDEPELGLHPTAIKILAALIRQASFDSQIIISTQSTRLVDEFEPENIIVVDRKNDASEFRRLSSEELKYWLEDYIEDGSEGFSLGELWEKNIFGGKP